MTIEFPLGLLGLITLPLIVALHLLQQRNRTVEVSHLALWNFLEKQIQGARFRRIPLNILLVLDLLIATLFSFALAQPRLTLPISFLINRHRIVVLDISTSMKAEDVAPNRFERARAEILSLAGASGFGDVFTLITAGRHARLLGDTRYQSMEDILTKLQALEVGDTGSSIQEALLLAEALREPSLFSEVHLYTDGAWDSPNLSIPDGVHPIWHWLGKPLGNQAVLDVSASKTAAQEWEVSALVINFADQPVRRIVSLIVDDSLIESIPIDIAPAVAYPIQWKLDRAPNLVSISLSKGDVLPDDDVASVFVGGSKNIRVALVSDQPKEILKALKAFQMVTVQTYASANELPRHQFDLVIYHKTLPQDYRNQKILLLNPPATQWLPWEETLSVDYWVAPIEDSITTGLDANGLRGVLLPKLGEIPRGFETLLQTTDDPPIPVLLKGIQDQADLMIFLPQLESGNLLRHPFWVSFLGNLLANFVSPQIPPKIPSGSVIPIPSSTTYPSVRISTPSGDSIVLGEDRAQEWLETHQSGIYRLRLVNRSGIESDLAVGVNAGDWQESNLLRVQKDLENGSTDGSTQVSFLSSSFNLTPWLLGFAVLLLLLEARYAWR